MSFEGVPGRKLHASIAPSFYARHEGNALRLLEIFHGDAELGVSELSRRLSLHKNNVFRLLATLELGGYVEQSSQTDCYRLGVRCLELGSAYARSYTLNERVASFELRPVLCARPSLTPWCQSGWHQERFRGAPTNASRNHTRGIVAAFPGLKKDKSGHPPQFRSRR